MVFDKKVHSNSPQETPSANKETIEDNSKSRICKCGHQKEYHIDDYGNLNRCYKAFISKLYEIGHTHNCPCKKYEGREA